MDETVTPGACWQPIDRFAELRSRWVTLIGEHLRVDTGDAGIAALLGRLRCLQCVAVLQAWRSPAG